MPMNQPGTPAEGTGAHAPAAAKSSDGGGERSSRMVNGIAMGKADNTKGRGGVGQHDGYMGEFNGGRKEHECYSHKRIPHAQGK